MEPEDRNLDGSGLAQSSSDSSTSNLDTDDSLSSSLTNQEKRVEDVFIDEEAVFLVTRLESMNIALQRDAKVMTFGDVQERIRKAVKIEHEEAELAPPERTSSAIDGGASRDSITDWVLWGKILGNYDSMVRHKPKLVLRAIKLGIPDRVRGLAWQQISRSKDSSLEDTYRLLHKCPSPVEKLIQRDLPRTFPRHQHFSDPNGKGQNSLFQVMKTYSMFDPEVGYCQGLSFIVGCLVLCMPDEEAFCLLVKLMNGYNMRGMYSPRMESLQLRLYQFNKALSDQLPEVDRHLSNEGIRSSMYASQWFLTLFAYRFPLPVVFRIMDVILAEGFDFIFRVSIALMKRNMGTLLSLSFESLIEYLKNGLFDVYIGNVTMLVEDAFNVRITKRKLDRWAAEYQAELNAKPSSADAECASLKRDIGGHISELKHLREAYEMIRLEYQAVQTKALLYENANRGLRDELESARESIQSYRSVFESQVNEAELQVANEMQAITQKNKSLSSQNVELKVQNEELLHSIIEIKLQLAQVQMEKEELLRLVHSSNKNSMTSSPTTGASSSFNSPSSNQISPFRNIVQTSRNAFNTLGLTTSSNNSYPSSQSSNSASNVTIQAMPSSHSSNSYG